jgi:Taurine catabolism dioxygenase TauD, TfdA family
LESRYWDNNPASRKGLDVGLLCLNASKSGGASRIASSVTVHNRMLASRPDLVKVLTEDFYRSRTRPEGGGRGLSADRRGKRARHRLPARRHPVPQQLRDAAHAA